MARAVPVALVVKRLVKRPRAEKKLKVEVALVEVELLAKRLVPVALV